MDQPISFQLLGSEESQRKLEGVAMELEDSLYPLLREVINATLISAPQHFKIPLEWSRTYVLTVFAASGLV